jgi:hypothetical protein
MIRVPSGNTALITPKSGGLIPCWSSTRESTPIPLRIFAIARAEILPATMMAQVVHFVKVVAGLVGQGEVLDVNLIVLHMLNIDILILLPLPDKAHMANRVK